MTTFDIVGGLNELYRTDISTTLIFNVTIAVKENLLDLQSRGFGIQCFSFIDLVSNFSSYAVER
jgi:hypothetical protein